MGKGHETFATFEIGGIIRKWAESVEPGVQLAEATVTFYQSILDQFGKDVRFLEFGAREVD
jgi:hypothetical protein